MYINLDVQTDFEIKSLSDLKKFKELMVDLKMKINKSQLARELGVVRRGITDFPILSDGRKVDNQRFTAKMEQKLKREQRKLSRHYEQAKKEGRDLRECMNYQKQRRKVARLRERVAFQREDFLNKQALFVGISHFKQRSKNG